MGPLLLACALVSAITYPIYFSFLVAADSIAGDRRFLSAVVDAQRWMLDTFLHDWRQALLPSLVFCGIAFVIPSLVLYRSPGGRLAAMILLGGGIATGLSIYLSGEWVAVEALVHAATGVVLGILFAVLANHRSRARWF